MLSKNNQALPAITLLKKLCNHPLLIREASSSQVAGYDECLPFFPPDYGRARDGCRADTSGKLLVLQRLLLKVRAETDDRFVLVSNYTSMLDVFGQMAREFGWSYVRLDGSTSQKKRTALVAQFNEKRAKGDDVFLFLLSSKAGGCGLNLIGGNRLVLFDPDWNPANDKQAAARVWRDGQTKRVYIYRMVIAGSIEEFVYERQLSKEGLAGVASNEQVLTSALSTSELKDLFTYHADCGSHFHEKLKVRRAQRAGGAARRAGPRRATRSLRHRRRAAHRTRPRAPARTQACAASSAHPPLPSAPLLSFSQCARCATMLEERAGERTGLSIPQLGAPKETDGLDTWAHHHGPETVDDEMMREAGEGLVSFIFSLHVSGRDVGELAAIAAQRDADALAKAAAAASAEAAAAADKENAARALAGRRPAMGAPLMPVGRAGRAGALAQRAPPPPPARPARPKRARVEAVARHASGSKRDESDESEEEPSSGAETSDESSASVSASADDDDDDDDEGGE